MSRKRIIRIAALLLGLAIIAYCVELAVPKRDYFVQRSDGVAEVGRIVTEIDGVVDENIRLRAASGLEVSVRVRRPVSTSGGPVPVLLVMGGYNTGKDAVALADAPKGVAFAAIDYPYTEDESVQGLRQRLATIPDMQRAVLDSPAALLAALQWLQQQAWVDPERIELVGASLGVPFAAIAGALDPRVRRLWLLHGGADNVSWTAHVGRGTIENPHLRRLVARSLIFLMHGNTFDTPSWIVEMAPRPVIIVMAENDDFVPREAQQAFFDLRDEAHVELILTDGRHVRPGRQTELQQLLDIVLLRLNSP